LNESTFTLDPETVREVLDTVVELAREGMTMVLVTHEMSVLTDCRGTEPARPNWVTRWT
jgi:ABC-type polar amino acid transport system ATPase subunit